MENSKKTIVFIAVTIMVLVSVGSSQNSRTLIVPDEYKTIQKAIMAAHAGDTVEIKPGIYDESLTFKDGVNLQGTVREKVILRCDAKMGSVITVRDCQSGTISKLTMMHIGVDKSAEGLSIYFPILYLKDSSIKITQCSVQDGGGVGISIDGAGNCQVRECDISGNARSGILVSHEGTKPTLKNNRCSGNGGSGIYFVEGAGGLAEGNICSKNVYNGISVINEWTSPELKSNQCSENQASGIYFGGGAKGIAEYNICKANNGHGIIVADDSSAAILKNNQCLSNKQCGIYYSYRTHITSKGNILKDNGEINYRQLRRMLWARKFDELEETALKLRTEKSEFANGNLQLVHFYYSLAED